MKPLRLIASCLIYCAFVLAAYGQDEAESQQRGSLIEDRAAAKLLQAGDARFETEEVKKAIEIWQSVIERYPRSRVRFQAHQRLGDYYLQQERAYDRARVHFDSVAAEDNPDEDQRAAATLKLGVCFYESANYGKCFQVMRDVIENYPVSRHVNQAYYYIGLGHFKLGHYSRAIEALEKVGTTLAGDKGKVEKLEAGKRFFIKIEDADLAALDPEDKLSVRCETDGGDVETVTCYPLGRNVRVVLGSIPTALGRPQEGNGQLEVRGDDTVTVTYIDGQTADEQFDRPILQKVSVVGDAVVTVTDGAFSESLTGVVLGKAVNLQIVDADRDLTDDADTVTALVEIYRRDTEVPLDELPAETSETAADPQAVDDLAAVGPAVPYTKIDELKVTLTESQVASAFSQASDPPASDLPAAEEPPADETAAVQTVQTGVFRAVIPLARSEAVELNDAVLQALPGDLVRVTYHDERNTGDDVNDLRIEVRCVDGNLGGVRVTQAVISDLELRIKTQLKTADALTNIGNRYKEFGLQQNAEEKYRQALAVCEQIVSESSRVGGSLLEQTYVQLWKIYFEMDQLNLAAAMCQRLQREFPQSGFVDDALLQLADVARKQGEYQRAIGIYNRLVNMQTSQLRGEAQFGVAECYDEMAEAAPATSAEQLHERAFQEYKKVFDNFPESGRVGEAVAKMANFYYRRQDYARAIDAFETVLGEYPDAKFLDVILFNYGRCLYRMNRRREARQRFDQLIGEFPESPLAADSKKISDALAKAGY